jgi:hypothetical protein
MLGGTRLALVRKIAKESGDCNFNTPTIERNMEPSTLRTRLRLNLKPITASVDNTTPY